MKRSCRKRTWSLFHCSFHHNRFHLKKHFLGCAQWLSDPNLGISLRSGRFIPMSRWIVAQCGPSHLRCQPGHKGDCGHFHGNIIISGQGAVRHCTLFKTSHKVPDFNFHAKRIQMHLLFLAGLAVQSEHSRR